jgi:hypothetical protein
LLQLSKEVSRNPLQLQEILQDFFWLLSRYGQQDSSNKINCHCWFRQVLTFILPTLFNWWILHCISKK